MIDYLDPATRAWHLYLAHFDDLLKNQSEGESAKDAFFSAFKTGYSQGMTDATRKETKEE